MSQRDNISAGTIFQFILILYCKIIVLHICKQIKTTHSHCKKRCMPRDKFVLLEAIPPEVNSESDAHSMTQRVHKAEHGQPKIRPAAKLGRLMVCGRSFGALLRDIEQHHI
jgi:hypothetical protein